MRDHPRSLTIREFGIAGKRIGFSPLPPGQYSTELCSKCHQGVLVDLTKDGKMIQKCDHCACEVEKE